MGLAFLIMLFLFLLTQISQISRNLLPSLFFVSRESREKREDFFHRWIFGLTQNLTKAYIACARMYHPAESTRQSRQARAKRRAICEIREICVRQIHRTWFFAFLRDLREIKETPTYPPPRHRRG